MTRNHPDPLSYLSGQPHKAKHMRLSTRSPYPPSYPRRRHQTLHAHHPFRRQGVSESSAGNSAGRPAVEYIEPSSAPNLSFAGTSPAISISRVSPIETPGSYDNAPASVVAAGDQPADQFASYIAAIGLGCCGRRKREVVYHWRGWPSCVECHGWCGSAR